MATIGYGYGSEWHLLQHLGRRRAAFTRRIQAASGCADVRWLDHEEQAQPSTGSPTLRELRGLEFLTVEDPVRNEWERFWPKGGGLHTWDAVGQATFGGSPSWILLEAKANLAELRSSCTAVDEGSVQRIRDILAKTQSKLSTITHADWTRDYYQYCNRLALLHFLWTRNIDAHLVFVYFTGDRMDIGRAGRECPADQHGWRDALDRQERHVGLPPTSPIRQRLHHVFVEAYRANIAEQVLKPEYSRSGRVPPLPTTPLRQTPAAVSSDLAHAFDEVMMQIYLTAKKDAGYNATRFLQMLNEHGGLETARRLLPHMSDGFTELWQRKRLDLTVEMLILQPRWHDLFSDGERDIARRRLRDCGAKV
jgi:hypothetical protein